MLVDPLNFGNLLDEIVVGIGTRVLAIGKTFAVVDSFDVTLDHDPGIGADLADGDLVLGADILQFIWQTNDLPILQGP